MQEIFKLLIGIAVLFLGIPIGNVLARYTKEELKPGKIWFKTLLILSLCGGLIALIFKNDAIMFTCFFIAIVVTRSLK